MHKAPQIDQRNRARTVSVQELQARLLALLSPDTQENLAQTVPLTSHGLVIMVLLPWYHFSGHVSMVALQGNLGIIREPISSSDVRRRSTALHGRLQQLAAANPEFLVALVILRHTEPIGAVMLWDQYELLYPNAASVLLPVQEAAAESSAGGIATLTIVQARNRMLRLPEDFAAGVVKSPLVVTRRNRRALLIIPYPECESG